MDDDDDDLSTVVPEAFTQTVRRREPEEPLKPFTLESMKGQQVVVRANGFSYRGLLVGADESDIYLRGEMRWVVLPLDTITDVKKA